MRIHILKDLFRLDLSNGAHALPDIDHCMAPTNCPVLVVPMKVNKGKKGAGKYSPTIDRIIPEKGYVKANVVVMSKLANEIKSDSTSPNK